MSFTPSDKAEHLLLQALKICDEAEKQARPDNLEALEPAILNRLGYATQMAIEAIGLSRPTTVTHGQKTYSGEMVKARAMFLDGKLATRAGQPNSIIVYGIETLQKVVHREPENVTAWNLIAEACLRVSDFDGARSASANAIHADRSNVQALEFRDNLENAISAKQQMDAETAPQEELTWWQSFERFVENPLWFENGGQFLLLATLFFAFGALFGVVVMRHH